MLRKRLIAVVTVRGGWAVQSFGYSRYIPIGRPERLVENLDRWGVDEILVQVIDRSTKQLGPDLQLLKRLGKLGIKTPLIYGGGINTPEHAKKVIQNGADRITLDHVLLSCPNQVYQISSLLGAQAVIASVPLRFTPSPQRLCYKSNLYSPFNNQIIRLIDDNIVSELLLIDFKNEGGSTSFSPSLIKALPFSEASLILFGGFSDPIVASKFFALPTVSAVCVGNIFCYHEHSYQTYKNSLVNVQLRPSFYSESL